MAAMTVVKVSSNAKGVVKNQHKCFGAVLWLI